MTTSLTLVPARDLDACEAAGHADGLAAGLALAVAGVDVPAAAPGRFAAVPGSAPSAGPDNQLAAAEGVTFVACAPAATHPDRAAVSLRLAAARLGLVRRLVDAAIAHVSERTSAGEPLIRKQLVTGAIADLVAETEALRRLLAVARVAPGPAVLADAHAQLTDLGWRAAMLFGASGYLADSATRGLYVSALVANTWTEAAE